MAETVHAALRFRHLHVLERVRDGRNPHAFPTTLVELARMGLIGFHCGTPGLLEAGIPALNPTQEPAR
ncbi:hypothetical protein TSA6c_00335 [Azospirillum sp. TSA6c]|uniref:hypothetical protein n=1 Tax=Azospirillum sp. TSA6c TaxID=709813 RepID=UPI000D61742A|nr:hypothetical protein [Azospirillum sp. TSA6c]PWC54409.1 hypothetical protein TSA6c_00335 [Azospirillum sp. TSA6c]